MISALILTKNEECNLPDCLESVAWCDDIVVYDSYSDDQTTEIARQHGARVYQRVFDDYASQRNAALHQVDYPGEWVLMLDADERASSDLGAEICSRASEAPDETTVFQMRRKDMLMGRWLRRSSAYPTWFRRLVRPDRVQVRRAINEEYHTDGIVENLHHHIMHYPFNRGFEHWFRRHNKYSSLEAKTLLGEQGTSIPWRHLHSRDTTDRRAAWKQLAYRLPGRPLLAFCYLYIVRRGFMDGAPGFLYSTLRATYEFMIDVKMREIRRRERGEAV